MSKRPITSASAPKAIGPYSQAVAVPAGEMIFLSGQVGIDPSTQRLVEGGVAEQTKCALANLRAVLGAANLTVDHIVRTTVYLTTMEDFETMNRVYADFFARGVKPARATVAVAELPAGAKVEIDAIAVRTR